MLLLGREWQPGKSNGPLLLPMGTPIYALGRPRGGTQHSVAPRKGEAIAPSTGGHALLGFEPSTLLDPPRSLCSFPPTGPQTVRSSSRRVPQSVRPTDACPPLGIQLPN